MDGSFKDDKVLELDNEMSQQEIMRMVEELDSTELEDTDKYVMRELLRGDKKDLFFKTDLNMSQIRGVVRLLTIDKIMKAQSMSDVEKAKREIESVPVEMTDTLMKLLVSKNRKGRFEFIKAWIGGEDKDKDNSLFSKWRN